MPNFFPNLLSEHKTNFLDENESLITIINQSFLSIASLQKEPIFTFRTTSMEILFKKKVYELLMFYFLLVINNRENKVNGSKIS